MKFIYGICFPIVIYFSLFFFAANLIERNFAVVHEPAHLVAGTLIWSKKDFSSYNVNPPLVRLIASAFAFFDGSVVPQEQESLVSRKEFCQAHQLIRMDPTAFRKHFIIGRYALLLFVLMPFLFFVSYAKFFLCQERVVFIVLFVFSPYILGSIATIIPDLTAAIMGIIAVCYFRQWLKQNNKTNAIVSGLFLGIAGLCKFTLLVFYPLFIFIWIFYKLPAWRLITHHKRMQVVRHSFCQILLLILVSIFVVNSGYLFKGTFTPLEDFRFQTIALTGYDSLEEIPEGGANRFAGTWLGKIPVPLPADMVQGIDTQKLDFERGLLSYVRGEHADHGWWYYYLYALLVKMPLGTWGLLGLAVVCSVFLRGYNAPWRDEMIILLPFLAIFIFVSSQTGFSVHSRYIIPALPFLFIWISKVGRAFTREQLVRCPRSTKIVRGLAVFFLVWMIVSSLWIYPHSLSYFNELAAILPTPEDENYPEQIVTKTDATSGLFTTPFKMLDSFFSAGPKNGPRHLLDSNIDWGQDLFYLEDWYESHPEARPFRVAYWGSYPLELSKIKSSGRPPVGSEYEHGSQNIDPMTVGPLPGYYALSVNEIYSRSKQYRYFLYFEPVARAGYSIYIYHITLDEVNLVRKKIGLPKLPKGWRKR